MSIEQNLKAPAILFTDWDGTVTMQDSNDLMTEELGFGLEQRLDVNEKILTGELNFRDGFRLMLDSIKKPFGECIEFLLHHIKLDPGFRKTFEWCQAKGIPVIVISSGMEPIIEALLTKLVGADAAQSIQIVSNGVKIHEDRSWEIIYLHPESGFGHDKARSIAPYSKYPKGERPVMFYAGDGVSDLSAAKECDMLFAKRGKDLIRYCERERIPYTQFGDYEDILDGMKLVVDGKKTVEELIENHM